MAMPLYASLKGGRIRLPEAWNVRNGDGNGPNFIVFFYHITQNHAVTHAESGN
jgi:hypothetical protein